MSSQVLILLFLIQFRRFSSLSVVKSVVFTCIPVRGARALDRGLVSLLLAVLLVSRKY